MTRTSWLVGGAVFVAVTALAGYAPWAGLRVAALIVFLVTVPAAAAVVVARRVVGRGVMLDLQIGAALAVALLTLLAVGAFFLGLRLPLHRGLLIIALAVLTAALLLGLRASAVPERDPIDAAEPWPRARVRWGGGRFVAVGLIVVFVAAAVVVAVLSQQAFDRTSEHTALGIRQVGASRGTRIYDVQIGGDGRHAQRLVLTLRITGERPTRSPVDLKAGQTVHRTVRAPSGASISADLARASSPASAFRSVHIGH